MLNKELVNASELAEFLGVSRAHIHRLKLSGRLPAPIHLGRSVRWCITEIKEWIAAKSPPREQWESTRGK